VSRLCGESIMATTPHSDCCVVRLLTTQRKSGSVCGVSPPNTPCVRSRHKA
jgi:hypothetical protein